MVSLGCERSGCLSLQSPLYDYPAPVWPGNLCNLVHNIPEAENTLKHSLTFGQASIPGWDSLNHNRAKAPNRAFASSPDGRDAAPQ